MRLVELIESIPKNKILRDAELKEIYFTLKKIFENNDFIEKNKGDNNEFI
jgi:hypothetical protein